jgi:hypothetical protein
MTTPPKIHPRFRAIDVKDDSQRRRAFHGLIVCGVAFLVAAPTWAADQISCAGLKQAISDKGMYVYHYKDPAKPDLELYTRFVKTALQCNADEALVYSAVPLLKDCDVPTCIQQDGDSSQ